MRVTTNAIGVTAAGDEVTGYVIQNDAGLTLECMTYGATINRLLVPDRSGEVGDVVLGFPSLAQYESQSPYFGAVIGRYANRIRDGRFALDHEQHQLSLNEGRHHLHGGRRGFDKHVWTARPIERAAGVGVAFGRVSPSGEQGYPGELTVEVAYLVNATSHVTIRYQATTTAPTIVNLTQHTYFDLSAGASPDVLGHNLEVRARAFLPVDHELLPTGEVAAVASTPFDFSRSKPIGMSIADDHEQLRNAGGYDHTWVLEAGDGPAVVLSDPRSGRWLEITTTEPGVQVY